MLYHASPVKSITVLEPRVSNHEKALVYLSEKRENVLVYLSNAVEKHCIENGFNHNGPWYKWASYGFSKEGLLVLEEYYPNAAMETYQGVSGYIYQAERDDCIEVMQDIPYAFISSKPLPVSGCEFVPDAYKALLEAERNGLIIIRRYHDLTAKQHRWLEKVIPQEYAKAENHPDYRQFLQSKFSSLLSG